MSRDYRVEYEAYDQPHIAKCYNEPGVSWREAKKQLREWYLERARALRQVSEKDYFTTIVEPIEEEEVQPHSLKSMAEKLRKVV